MAMSEESEIFRGSNGECREARFGSQSNKVLLSLVGERDMLISLHKTRATKWDFLLILDMQKTSKMDLLKDQVETVLVMSGFTVTNRIHNGINILEMRDSETRDIFYIAFVDNHW